MSSSRLMATAAAMALIAAALDALTPGLGSMVGTVAAAQRTVDTAGPDVLLVSAAGLLAWAVWAWGALGLSLTAASVLPGVLGGAADAAVRLLLPAAARRSAALALGLGLGVAGPLLGSAAPMTTAPAAAAVPLALPTAAPVADWPTAPPVPIWPTAPPVPDWPTAPPVPDWPTAPAGAAPAPDRPAVPSDHVVVRGDCLWHIAGGRLLARHGRAPTDGEVAAATQAWWQANAQVIGPDPDLLLPGQVLSPPDSP